MNAVEVRGVSKTYRIPHERQTTLVERLLSTFRRRDIEILAALKDVSLEIPPGCFAGIIGANGSGKSTLLKLLAGVLVPDRGEVRVNGSVAPLLELGLGFHQELTVRENVVLYGTVLGYPRQTMTERVHEVIAFAGLERFRDAKLKSLSSGMLMRLAFATAIRADADILLLDEVLAVGDAQFQRRCHDVFVDLHRRGRTIVLVTHDLSAVGRFCEKVFWLDNGRLVLAGDRDEVLQAYVATSQIPAAGSVYQPESSLSFEHRFGDGQVRYVGGRLETESGQVVTRVTSGTRVVLSLQAHTHDRFENLVFGIVMRRGSEIVYASNTGLQGIRTGPFARGDRIDLRIPFTAALANGYYIVDVAVADPPSGVIYDWINNFATFVVEGSRCGEGVADVAAEFSYTRRDDDPA
jgi:lipopolysaccharide transport system ATP-binding protein